MARSTGKSLAGQAASAARTVIARSPVKAAKKVVPTTRPPVQRPAPLKATAPQAAATTAAAKKTAAQKTAAQKTAAQKTAAKKTAVEKPVGKKPAVKKAAEKKAPPTKAGAPTKAATTTLPVPASKPATSTTSSRTSEPAKKAAPVKKATSAPVQKTAQKATTKTATKAAATKTAAAKKSAPAKKSAAARKAPVSALVVKEGETAWTKAELKEVLDELHEQREHSSTIVEAQTAELSGLMRDAGDGAGQDQADLGATSFERDHELKVLNNERDKLAQIERALERIDVGTYGVCESCGEPIGKMRLMAFPRATLCMTCKQREERR